MDNNMDNVKNTTKETKITDEISFLILDQLDYIHEVLQEVKEGNIDYAKIGEAIDIIEYAKEPFLRGLSWKEMKIRMKWDG